MQPISSHLQAMRMHLKPDWRTVETDCWLSTKQAGSQTHFLKSGGTLSKAHPALKLILLRIIFLKTFLTCDLLNKLCICAYIYRVFLRNAVFVHSSTFLPMVLVCDHLVRGLHHTLLHRTPPTHLSTHTEHHTLLHERLTPSYAIQASYTPWFC